MKVVICGAGQVGANIAKYLAHEGNDVTIVDLDPHLVRDITDQLDVHGGVAMRHVAAVHVGDAGHVRKSMIASLRAKRSNPFTCATVAEIASACCARLTMTPALNPSPAP